MPSSASELGAAEQTLSCAATGRPRVRSAHRRPFRRRLEPGRAHRPTRSSEVSRIRRKLSARTASSPAMIKALFPDRTPDPPRAVAAAPEALSGSDPFAELRRPSSTSGRPRARPVRRPHAALRTAGAAGRVGGRARRARASTRGPTTSSSIAVRTSSSSASEIVAEYVRVQELSVNAGSRVAELETASASAPKRRCWSPPDRGDRRARTGPRPRAGRFESSDSRPRCAWPRASLPSPSATRRRESRANRARPRSRLRHRGTAARPAPVGAAVGRGAPARRARRARDPGTARWKRRSSSARPPRRAWTPTARRGVAPWPRRRADPAASDSPSRSPRPDPGAREATMPLRADVAELVDAHGSGPCARKGVEVQVLSSALWDG